MRVNLLKSIGGIIVCGYILLLACRDQLGFYIHPRYHIFASIISIVGIILLLIDTMLQLKLKASVKPAKFSLKSVKPASYLAIIILLAGYLLPPKPLSPNSLAQRESPAIIELESRCEVPKPKEDSSTISINRWKTAIHSCKQTSYFNNTDISITGFVSNGLLQNYGYNYFYIARYVISCCAVDSVPMKILVEKNFFIDYPDGTWLTVKGKLSQKVVNGQAEYVITDARATKIDQPKYPYELLGV
ncbi:TIGR03943 family protein [TM7 phylum sp. oral taxon 353]|nr:TIGR03943 family protein [TM7 phylum sp. oral taxon 353]